MREILSEGSRRKQEEAEAEENYILIPEVFWGRINYFCEIELFKDTKDIRQKTRKM